jgi:hypothetical protein
MEFWWCLIKDVSIAPENRFLRVGRHYYPWLLKKIKSHETVMFLEKSPYVWVRICVRKSHN